MNTDHRLSPQFLLDALKRQAVKMILFFFLAMSLCVVGNILASKTYRSQAKFFLRLGRENATLDPTVTLGQSPVVAVPYSRENEINSVTEVLSSQVVLERVLAIVGPEVVLGESPPGELSTKGSFSDVKIPERNARWFKALRLMNASLSIEAVKKSNIIALLYEAPSPELAQTVLRCLIEVYLDRHMELNRTPGTYAFLQQQATRLRDQVSKDEEELTQLKIKTGIYSPDSERQIIVARVGKLEEDLFQTESALAAAEAEISALKAQLESQSKTQITATTRGGPNQAVDQMRTQLYQLKVKERELLVKYPPSHPEVRQVREAAEYARKLLDQEPATSEQVTTGPNRLYEESALTISKQEAQLASLKARQATVQQQLALERKRLNAFTRDEIEIARVQRRLELANVQYRKYAESLEQGKIDQALQDQRISNIAVVQPATYDIKPIKPKLLMNLAIGFVLAVLGSLGIAFLYEYRRWSAATIPPEPLSPPHQTPTMVAENV